MSTSEPEARLLFGPLLETDEDANAQLHARLHARLVAAAHTAGVLDVAYRTIDTPQLDEVSRQLEEYFAGRRKVFELPLDFRLSKGFRRNVLAHLSEIAYGHTESYARVAAAAGSPKAVRAVGAACATNPLPVVVPCHRVVRSDGSLGGYVGGLQAKHSLLSLEAAV